MDRQIDMSVIEKEMDPDWDAFVSSLPCGHHVQTSLWGQVKAELDYRTIRIIARENEQIVAGGQLLIRQFAPLISMAYLPKGPLFSTWDPFLAETIIKELKGVVNKNRFILLAVQPTNYDQELKTLFDSNGFQPGWLELAPTATILLDLTPQAEEILSHMKRQTRQNILRSEREGITTREGTLADLPAFYHLHIATSQRQKFSPYPEKYFTGIWQILAPHGYISLILAEFGDEPVSALLLVPFGDTVIAKTLGWSGQYAECRPNDAVFWAAIQWAKTHGYRCFDFEGIDRRGAEIMVSGQPLPEELQHTPDFFKLGYGGQVALLPKSFELIANPLLRWPYRKIFEKTERGTSAYKFLDRFRRRFG